jgi:hypothetical protein
MVLFACLKTKRGGETVVPLQAGNGQEWRVVAQWEEEGKGEDEEGSSKMRKNRATEEPHVCKQNLSNSWHLAWQLLLVDTW